LFNFEPAAFFRRAADAFDPLFVAGDAWQVLALGPAAVAIHDDRDMTGASLGRYFQRP
jgi:hypothetical protein